MAISNENSPISKYFKTGVDVIIKQSQNILEISRLNLDILSMEKEINLLYLEIGETLFKEYPNHNTISKNMIKCCEEVSKLMKNISKAEENISKIKST